MSILDIRMSFEEIEKMPERMFKNLVKEKTEKAAFKYLEEEKLKQTKIAKIEHDKLQIQDYFIDGNCNTKLAKLIFKARSQTLDIKSQRKWKYADQICIGCKTLEESGDEIIICDYSPSFYTSPRRGSLFHIHPYRPQVKRAREASLKVKGTKLFNLIPQYLRDMTVGVGSQDQFKHALDDWLHTIPNQPTIAGRQRPTSSNSLLDQIPRII